MLPDDNSLFKQDQSEDPPHMFVGCSVLDLHACAHEARCTSGATIVAPEFAVDGFKQHANIVLREHNGYDVVFPAWRIPVIKPVIGMPLIDGCRCFVLCYLELMTPTLPFLS